MKKFRIVIATTLLLLTCSTLVWANRLQVTRMKPDWKGLVRWDKKVSNGSDSTYSTGSVDVISSADTLIISGASDSCYSRIFENKGPTSLALEIYGGTTVRLIAEVQVANPGYSAATLLADSLFKPLEWLTVGTGLANNIISTSLDSITTADAYPPIKLYIENAQFWRLLIRSTSKAVGNPRLIIRAFVRED